MRHITLAQIPTTPQTTIGLKKLVLNLFFDYDTQIQLIPRAIHDLYFAFISHDFILHFIYGTLHKPSDI